MTKKITLFSLVLIVALLLVPTICNAAAPVTTEAELVAAINSAASGDSIKLGADITLNAPILVSDKMIEIDGAGYTVKASDTWRTAGGSGNQSLFTAANNNGGNITLKNITLENSPKYGVQAYNGGIVVLNGVTIKNCKFGGVLVNGGILNIGNLTLGRNGESANNGIEIDKAQSSFYDPILTMDGKLSSTETENVIYLATNGSLSKFLLQNTERATNKILVTSEGKVVITNENNQVIYTAGGKNLGSDNIDGLEYIPNIKITLVVDLEGVKEEVTIEATPEEAKEEVSSDELKAKIEAEFAETGLDNIVVVGFYADEKYEKEFDFSKGFDKDTTIYIKLKTIEDAKTEEPKTELPAKEEKDDTPKTGTINYIVVAAIVLVVSSLGVVALKNKRA